MERSKSMKFAWMPRGIWGKLSSNKWRELATCSIYNDIWDILLLTIKHIYFLIKYLKRKNHWLTASHFPIRYLHHSQKFSYPTRSFQSSSLVSTSQRKASQFPCHRYSRQRSAHICSSSKHPHRRTVCGCWASFREEEKVDLCTTWKCFR